MTIEETNKKLAASITDEAFLNDRIVFVEGLFSEEMSFRVCRQLLMLREKNANAPIQIRISSYGGSAYSLLDIFSILKTLKCEVTTVGYGKCMSAGAFLLMAGDKRVAYPLSRIMLHEVSGDSPYLKLHDSSREIEESKELMKIIYSLVRKKTKIKNPEEYLKENHYLSASQAKKLGVVDVVATSETSW